jgi:TPR repeat protein
MLEKLKTEAIDGSPDAAIQVERHVAMIQGPSKEALKWALIAAENGSVDGEYTVGFILRYDPDADSRRRALFWLRRASTHGLQAAKNLLLEIERKKGSGSLLKK